MYRTDQLTCQSLARMMVGSRDFVTSTYKLNRIREIEDLVADAVGVVSCDPHLQIRDIDLTTISLLPNTSLKHS